MRLAFLLILSMLFARAPAWAFLQEERDREAKPLYGDPDAVPDAIEAAVARARRANKRVLVQWGAEWCGWCHLLQRAWTEDEELASKLLYEYEVVHASIGLWDRNLELAASLGAELRGSGVPYLTVLDGEGRPIANEKTGRFETEEREDGLRHDPAKLLAFLTENQAEYPRADVLRDEALASARASGKRVLLTFGAPWCGWCHRLEDWLVRPDVARVLGKDFVVAKIDEGRTIGGKEMLVRFRGGTDGGIPWFLFLDGDGKVLATSDGPSGNLGCPYTEAEKAVFAKILGRVAVTITAEEIGALVATLGPEPEQQGAGGDVPESTQREELRRWRNPVDSEFYADDLHSGSISLNMGTQELRLALHAHGDRLVQRRHAAGDLRPGFVATAFTQLEPPVLLMAGVQEGMDRSLVLRVRFDPATGSLVSVEDEFASRELRIPASLDVLPDARRVAILDRKGASVYVYDLEDRTLRRVADRFAAPRLPEMKYVHAWPVGEHGVKLWLTKVSAAHANSRLMGFSISLYDEDGDGEFEGIR